MGEVLGEAPAALPPLAEAKKEYNEALKTLKTKNAAATERAALALGIDDPSGMNIARAGKNLLDARDRTIATKVEAVLSDANFDRLTDLESQAFESGQSGLAQDFLELQNAPNTMNEPWKPSKLLGELGGNYAISQDRLYKLKQKIPTDYKKFGPEQKAFYEYYDWMLTELQNLVPGEREIYARKRARKDNVSLPEQQLNYGLKKLAILGIGAITVITGLGSIFQKKLSWVTVGGVGLLIYLTNPKLFQSMPAKMDEKLTGFKNPKFDAMIPKLTEDFAETIYTAESSELTAFTEHLKTLPGGKRLEETDYEDMGFSDEAGKILQNTSALDAYIVVTELAKQRGTDAASTEARNITLNAIKHRASTKALSKGLKDLSDQMSPPPRRTTSPSIQSRIEGKKIERSTEPKNPSNQMPLPPSRATLLSKPSKLVRGIRSFSEDLEYLSGQPKDKELPPNASTFARTTRYLSKKLKNFSRLVHKIGL